MWFRPNSWKPGESISPVVRYRSHDVNGISEADFRGAAQADALLA